MRVWRRIWGAARTERLGEQVSQSHYSSGLRILDTSKVVTDTQLTEVAYFESGNVVISGYDGVWMVLLHDDVARSLSLRENRPVPMSGIAARTPRLLRRGVRRRGLS